jgi:hypothetical protein
MGLGYNWVDYITSWNDLNVKNLEKWVGCWIVSQYVSTLEAKPMGESIL